jgi:hypothetical protein
MDTKTFYKSEIEQIKHEELEERKVNIRAILPSEKVGKIVGRGDGAVLKGLKTLFPNVELTVDRVSSRGGCLVHTFGQAFELEELWKRIITTMYLNINDRDKVVTDILYVANSYLREKLIIFNVIIDMYSRIHCVPYRFYIS